MTRRPLTAADLAFVGAGAAAGALLRWGIDTLSPATTVPWDVVAINVVGAFALGALPLLPGVRRSHRLALLLGPGLLGGFTTVSVWAEDVRGLAASGHALAAALTLGITLAAGLLAAHLGRRVSHRPEPEDAVT
ncbi:MAG: CrcB family protein [Nocardioides sp.]|nr:CrcB family protein [Nocardioides sp.]